MLLGARQFFERRGAPAWTNPYVTDGLVAMWDGEWNAGGGIHDPNATVWKDLVGSCDFTLVGGATFNENSLVLDNSSGMQYATASNISSFPSSSDLTFEVVCDRNANAVTIFKPPDAYKFGLMFYAPNYNTMGNRVSLPTFRDTDFPVGHYGSVTGVYGANNSLSVFIDGSAVNSVSSDSIGGSQNEATIGRRLSGSAYPLNGRVSNIRLYSRALTAAEIAANYAIDKARFNLP